MVTISFSGRWPQWVLCRRQVEQSGQTGGNAVAEKRIDLDYDLAGRWQEITRYADLAGTQLVAASDFTYDRMGRLTELIHGQDTTI